MMRIHLTFAAAIAAAAILCVSITAGALAQSVNDLAAQAKQYEEFRKQGKFHEAERLGLRLAQIVESRLGPNDPRLFALLGELGDLKHSMGKYREAEKLLLRAKEGLERTAGAGNDITLTILDALAQVYSAQGRYGEAEAVLKKVLAESEQSSGATSPQKILALSILAEAYARQGRFREAEPLAKRAAARAEAALGADNATTLQILNTLVIVYGGQGRVRQAEPILKRILKTLERTQGREHPNTLAALANMALIYSDEGRYREAEPFAKRALLSLERSVDKEHVTTLHVMGTLARLYWREGRYDEAEALGKRLLDGYERKLNPDHPFVLDVLAALGDFYVERGRYEEAEKFLQRAQTASERVYGKDNFHTLLASQSLAALYDATGRYGEAQKLHERVLADSEHALGKESTLALKAANYFGDHYLKQGLYSEAAPLLQRALAGSERVHGAGHPETLKVLYNIANLSFAQRDWADAVQSWRRSTALLVERAQRGAREGAGDAMIGKTKSETERTPQHFQGLIKAAHRLAPEGATPDAALAAEMFQAAQWALGSGAAASMAQMAARGAAASPGLAALVRERQDLVAEWQKLDAARDGALARKPEQRNANSEAENAARLSAIDARLKQIDRRLAAEFPDYASLASGAPLSVEAVQSALNPDEALVFFLDTPELKPAPEETFVWIVTKADMRWLRSELGSAALAREVQALRCGLDAAAWEGGDCARLTGQSYGDAEREEGKPLPFDHARAYQLYRALFGQAEDLISGKSLLLVPSGALTQLPFQVLQTDGPRGSGDKAAAWLIRRHALSVLPAVSSLKALRRVARPSNATKPMIGFGNPLLDGDQANAQFGSHFKALAQRARDAQSCAAAGGQAPMAMASAPARSVSRMRSLQGVADVNLIRMQTPLPETSGELCSVARDLKADANDIHLGGRAAEREIKRLSAGGELARYRVVHFATHGALAGELDRNSEPGLLLTPPASPSEQDDGYLTASEVAGLKLDADWVVLSACNTAGGGSQGAEALSGLARAFIYAQARALLVSHWAVNSDATVSLVTGAMRRIAADRTIGRAEAMRQSMLDLIESNEPQLAQPAYWAPFAVVGEGAATAAAVQTAASESDRPQPVQAPAEYEPPSQAPAGYDPQPAASPEDRTAALDTRAPLAPAEPQAAPVKASPAQQPEVSGQVTKIEDTATLVISGKRIKLAWVDGRGGSFVDQLHRYLAKSDSMVRCKLVKTKYRCYAGRENYDVGEAAILNGAASAGSGAPESYRGAQMQAQRDGVGIWMPSYAGAR